MNQSIIETNDLSVYYGRYRGIHELNLRVEEGEVYGFLGPNGAGKTTTLRVLLDIIRPTAGRAAVFGLDCQKDGVQIRRRIGYIPGELKLYAQLRADEYFDMVARVSGAAVDPAYRRQLCERLELDPRRPMRTYSRGNKQKAGLVAAFMRRPDLLILDEPTTGLDPLNREVFWQILEKVKADKSVVLTTHLMQEADHLSDRIGTSA